MRNAGAGVAGGRTAPPRPAAPRIPSTAFRVIPVLVLVLVAACGDLDTGPAVELRSEDPVVSLHFSDRLPTLPSLAERWAPELGLSSLTEAWQVSWEEDAVEGMERRLTAIDAAVPMLVEVVPASARREAFEQVQDAVRGAEEVLGVSFQPEPDVGDPLGVSAREARDPGLRERGDEEGVSEFVGTLQAAAGHLAAAEAARSAGDAAGELRQVLLASDLLRATTADALARSFIQQAEGVLRRISASASYASVTVERAERLLRGAREALDVGQPALALQRAWYAVGLLRAAETLDTPVPDRNLLESEEFEPLESTKEYE